MFAATLSAFQVSMLSYAAWTLLRSALLTTTARSPRCPRQACVGSSPAHQPPVFTALCSFRTTTPSSAAISRAATLARSCCRCRSTRTLTSPPSNAPATTPIRPISASVTDWSGPATVGWPTSTRSCQRGQWVQFGRAELASAGTVQSSFRYRGYGQIAQSFGATTPSYFGYAGQLTDPSGLYYMRARWYDPISGRFLSHDPLRGQGAVPPSLNVFLYAQGNPANNLDPTGLFCIGASFGGGFALGAMPFGSSGAGTAGSVSVALLLCAGGRSC